MLRPDTTNMALVRLRGREAGPSSDLWISASVIAPGGGTALSSFPQEKMYVCLDGTLTVSNGESEILLRNENRRLTNKTNSPVTVLLGMPLSADERQRAI